MKNDKLAERRQLWIDRVQQQIASGLNKKEWCHQNQVSLDAFYYWSEKLGSKKAVQKQRNAYFTELPLKASMVMKNYCNHPFARIDNNVSERALKHVVIGRKNWLFVGSEDGGESSAVLYSFAQTCRALKINPHEYFEDLFLRFQGHPANKRKELLPHNWQKLP